MASSPIVQLNSGYNMPMVGFGVWKVENAVAADTVYNAIKAGYRLIDGACDYGNEKECGEGVARAIKDGLVKREDLFIVSKLWPTFAEEQYVEPACRRSLADWGLDYFDLYLIHFPCSLAYVDPSVRYPPNWFFDEAKTQIKRGRAVHQETWAAMEKLVHKGMARSIGISNFQAQSIYNLLQRATIPPAAIQVELHPYYQQSQIIALAKAEGIVVTAYSSFGPASFIELDIETAQQITPLLEHDVIKALATKHKKTPAQILLRWATQRGVAVIPKTSRPEIMTQNLECTNFDLEQTDFDQIARLNCNLKFNQPSSYFTTDNLYIFG